MKQLSVASLRLLSATVVGTAITLGYVASAMAQSLPGPVVSASFDQVSLARLAADLAYPNSSQRFFKTGITQLEQEIRQLSDENEPSEPLLTVRPEVLEQFEDQ